MLEQKKQKAKSKWQLAMAVWNGHYKRNIIIWIYEEWMNMNMWKYCECSKRYITHSCIKNSHAKWYEYETKWQFVGCWCVGVGVGFWWVFLHSFRFSSSFFSEVFSYGFPLFCIFLYYFSVKKFLKNIRLPTRKWKSLDMRRSFFLNLQILFIVHVEAYFHHWKQSYS